MIEGLVPDSVHPLCDSCFARLIMPNCHHCDPHHQHHPHHPPHQPAHLPQALDLVQALPPPPTHRRCKVFVLAQSRQTPVTKLWDKYFKRIGKHALNKNMRFFCDFFPTWSGVVFPIPKTQSKQKLPLNHPKIISFWTRGYQKGGWGWHSGKIPK